MINPAVRTEMVREYGHRQVNRLVAEDTDVAHFIFDHFPGSYTEAEWGPVVKRLDREKRTLSVWPEDQK